MFKNKSENIMKKFILFAQWEQNKYLDVTQILEPWKNKPRFHNQTFKFNFN